MAQKIEFIDKVLSRIGRLDRESIQSYVTGLLEERKRSEQIFDQINEGIVILDREGIIRFANRRAFLWLGFSRFFKNRSELLDLTPEPLLKEFIMERLKKPNQSATEDFRVLYPREMSLRLHWVPLEEEKNEILLRIENITQEKNRQEEEVRIQNIEGMTKLAAALAHEIGNPLNSLQIHIGLLKNEVDKLPKAKTKDFGQILQVLAAEAKRLDQIVRSFLRATRRPPLHFKNESLNEILEESVRFFRPEMEEANVKLRLKLDKNLPRFLLDRDRLHQAFINLIKNALEAMPKGGELKISTGFRDSYCLVRFEDQGSGIDEKDLPHIFEAYYTTKEEGSGLGLSQVYQTVREHGGRIDVKSQLDKGTVFTLLLPVRKEKLPLPSPSVLRR